MGLHTTHGCYNGSYSGFGTERRKLAKLLGFELGDMEGFGGIESWKEINHPLIPLLNHPDYEGVLSISEQLSIINGFNLLNDKIQETNDEDLINFCNTFKKGCIDASNKNEIIEFQ